MNSKPRVLLVEDDPEIRALLSDFLQRQGFLLRHADGGAALDRLVAQYGLPDVVILDLMLPGEDGFAICQRLRASSTVPIIMLTARGDDIDRIVGLELGADDYLAKPFNPRELVARIRAVLRRANPPSEVQRRLFEAGNLHIDLDARSVVDRSGPEISLTGAEFDLLACFVTRPNRVLSRDQLMDWTRGRQADAVDRTIDVQVSRLRKKIERGDEPLIRTVRGAGYIWSAPVKEM